MSQITFRPSSDSLLNHICSTGSAGYVLINETAADDDASYIYQSVTGTSNVAVTSGFVLSGVISGYFKITSMILYVRGAQTSKSFNSSSFTANLFVGGSGGTSFGSGTLNSTSYTTINNTYNSSTWSALNDVLFNGSGNLPTISFNIETDGKRTYSNKGGNYQIRITQSYLVVNYDVYYSCSANIGNSNISVVSCTSDYIASGTSCTFSATCSVVFMGWYNNSSMSGTVVSKNKSYPATISSDTALYAFGYSVSSVGDSGVSSIDKTYNDGYASVTLTANLNNGYSFTGWYLNGTLLSSSTSYTYYPSSDNTTLNAVTSRIVYTLTAYGDDNCTTNITTNDYYYGTTATFLATITDTNNYTFVGWYSDASYTTLVSNSASYNYVITGNYTLYAKTKSLNTYYIKNNGNWVAVSKVWKKVNGTWTVIDPSDYDGLFLSDTNYVKIDM